VEFALTGRYGTFCRLPGTQPCADGWTGVSCENGVVTGLDFGYLTLAGTLAEAIGDLPRLVALNLNGNKLSSTLPASLGRLGELEQFSAHGNKVRPPAAPHAANHLRIRQDPHPYILPAACAGGIGLTGWLGWQSVRAPTPLDFTQLHEAAGDPPILFPSLHWSWLCDTAVPYHAAVQFTTA